MEIILPHIRLNKRTTRALPPPVIALFVLLQQDLVIGELHRCFKSSSKVIDIFSVEVLY